MLVGLLVSVAAADYELMLLSEVMLMTIFSI
jgi:hypothetical protein